MTLFCGEEKKKSGVLRSFWKTLVFFFSRGFGRWKRRKRWMAIEKKIEMALSEECEGKGKVE